MANLRAIIKCILFVLTAIVYLLSSFIGQLFIRDLKSRRHFFTRHVSRFTRFGVWFLQVKVIVKNPPKPEQNYLFVGNHMGMMDIICLSSVRETLFITSVEMQKTPGLGLLCEMGGCIFVERRNRANIPKEILQIREALTQGNCVTLYPEGTSTNGERILPFKKSMLVAAAGTGIPMKPMVLNYKKINGEPMSDRWRDYICWYGDQTFLPALWRTFSLKSIEAEIEFLEEMHIESDDQRREVAAQAQARIEAKFIPILKPAP